MKRRGHAVLELALSIGMMATVLGGTFQFGYTFYLYNELVTAVGNGARYGAQRTYSAADAEDIEKGRVAIQNMVVYGESRPSASARPVIPGLRPEDVLVDWKTADNEFPEAVFVQIKSYKVEALFGEINLSGRPAVEFPFVGRYAPEESEP